MNTGNPTPERVRRAFERAARSYNSAAEVQRQTLRELIDALPHALRSAGALQATRIIDVGCGTGMAAPLLAARYPDAQLIGLDFAPAMLRAATEHAAGQSIAVQHVCADAAQLPLCNAASDLVLSSLTYQWCVLPKVLSEAHRVLRAGGCLAFTTLTPGTFAEITQAFSGIDRHPHTLALQSTHDIMQAVQAAGFTALRQRAVRHIAYYPDLRSVLQNIRATGANEISGQRRSGLLGKTAWRNIEARYASLANTQGQLPLSYAVLEVIAHRPA